VISNKGLVAIKKMGGETYITITDKGEDVSAKLLQDLIAYEGFADMNKKPDDNDKFVSKGVRKDPGLERVEKKLAEKISEINLQFEDELRTIEDDA
jgi:DNA-binding PadR family transcriptional regulator